MRCLVLTFLFFLSATALNLFGNGNKQKSSIRRQIEVVEAVKPAKAATLAEYTDTESSSESDTEYSRESFDAARERVKPLARGLQLHTVLADDGHPLTVYSMALSPPDLKKLPILLLHGRTWSSLPVYHLSSRSTMQSLHDQGFHPYAVDFRGFGGTSSDETGYVQPLRSAKDAEDVLRWIAERHGLAGTRRSQGDDCPTQPALLGWSQGGLVAQLVAQRSPQLISRLVLYSTIYDPSVVYPRLPLYTSGQPLKNVTASRLRNTFDGAIEDFTVEASIGPNPVSEFARACLIADPFKNPWFPLHEFNLIQPAKCVVPTLVIVGDNDPYTSLTIQINMFATLGVGLDRSMSIIAGADHVAHLLDNRQLFINTVTGFLKNVGVFC